MCIFLIWSVIQRIFQSGKMEKKSPEKWHVTWNSTDRAPRSAMTREPISSCSVVANLLGNNIPCWYFRCYPMGTIWDGTGREKKGWDGVRGSLSSLDYKDEGSLLNSWVSLGSTPSYSSSVVANLLGNIIPCCYLRCYLLGTIRDGTWREGAGFGVRWVH